MTDAKHDAMTDLIAAVKAGDAAKAALAFQRAYEACAHDKAEGPESKPKPKGPAKAGPKKEITSPKEY